MHSIISGSVYSFSEVDTDNRLAIALKYCQIQVDTSLLKSDLIKSWAMLQREGLFITFSHHLFQEYFTAVFLSKVEFDNYGEIIEALASRGSRESTIVMLYDMAPDRLETLWLGPFVRKMAERFAQSSEDSKLPMLVREYFGAITIDPKRGILPQTNSKLYRIMQAVIPTVEVPHSRSSRLSSASQAYQNDEDVLDRCRKFFGDLGQFRGKYFTPNVDDRVWLTGSQVHQEIVDIAAFLKKASDWLQESRS